MRLDTALILATLGATVTTAGTLYGEWRLTAVGMIPVGVAAAVLAVWARHPTS